MRVRTFLAANMPEAIAMVRAEMGEDAVILSSQRSRRGFEIKAASEHRPTPASQPLENVDPVFSRLAALEAEFERRLVAAVAEPRPAAPSAQTAPVTLEAIVQRLTFHEMPRPLIERLGAAAARHGMADGYASLAHALGQILTFDPLSPDLGPTIALVGQPGAGKTACAAKLAVRCILAGRPATLISTDDSAGAASQLAAFGEVIGTRVISVEGPEALAVAIDTQRQQDPDTAIIVDTAGVNPFDRAETGHLRDLLTVAEAEPIMVTPSAGGRDLEDHAVMFKALGVRRVIATRLDLTRRLGGLFGAVASVGLAFAQGSASPYIAETLEPLDALALARRLLSDSDVMTVGVSL